MGLIKQTVVVNYVDDADYIRMYIQKKMFSFNLIRINT